MKRLSVVIVIGMFVCGLMSSLWSQGSETSSDATKVGKEVVQLLAKGDFSGVVGRFDETMRGALPPEKLEEAWHAVLVQAGPLKRQVAVRTEEEGSYSIVFVTCEFERAVLDVKAVVNGDGEVSGLFFLPGRLPKATGAESSSRPKGVKEKEVVIGLGGWKLPGTLSLPPGDGPFPAVVLVHGSGPSDRDETIGPNKPFQDLAWGLASKGIAVLRYDKRTKVYPEKMVELMDRITVREETIDDALEAVSLLREEKEVDPDRIFVLGHSLGGMLVPRIGALDPGIRGFIGLQG